MLMILLLQAPLVALTRSLGEVTSHAEASLAALQVVFQVNISIVFCATGKYGHVRLDVKQAN